MKENCSSFGGGSGRAMCRVMRLQALAGMGIVLAGLLAASGCANSRLIKTRAGRKAGKAVLPNISIPFMPAGIPFCRIGPSSNDWAFLAESTVSGGTVLVDIRNARVCENMGEFLAGMECVGVSADGSRILQGDNNGAGLTVRDLLSGTATARYQPEQSAGSVGGRRNAIVAGELSEDGKLLAAGTAKELVLVDTVTGQRTGSIPQPARLTPDDLSAGDFWTMNLSTFAGENAEERLASYLEPYFAELSFSSDGTRLYGVCRAYVCAWEIPSCRELWRDKKIVKRGSRFRAMPGPANLLGCLSRGVFTVLDGSSGQMLWTTNLEAQVLAFDLSPDGNHVAAVFSGGKEQPDKLVQASPADGIIRYTIQLERALPSEGFDGDIAYSPDSSRLLVADHKKVFILDAVSGREVLTTGIESKTLRPRCGAFAPDGLNAVVGYQDTETHAGTTVIYRIAD